MKKLIFLFAAAAASLTVHAQEVKDFSLVNVANGKTVSLNTYPSCAGIVILFTSNACPYDEYYRGRIDKLARDYQDKVPVMLVNSHNDPNESVDNMKKKAAGWSLPYLADKEQVLMTTLGAAKSPSAYLLKNNGGKFVLIYSGAIDDNAQVEADVRHHHLKDAIDIMLANQKVATAEVRPAGCSIRKK